MIWFNYVKAVVIVIVKSSQTFVASSILLCNGQDLDQAAERKIELTWSGLGLDQCFARVRASGSALAAISAAFLMVNPADWPAMA